MIIDEITEKNYKEKLEAGKTIIEEKFKKWDILKKLAEIRERPIFEDKELRARAASYLRDPTIWAYALLKDKQNNPLKLKYFQDRIINDRHRFIQVVAANQIGKTWANCVKAIHHALNVNNASVLITSRSEPQAINVLDETKWMLKRASIDFTPVIGEIENRTELHLNSPDKKGVSVIRCFPPTTGVLGYPATLSLNDEHGFWEIDKTDDRNYFAQVVLSRINETKNWSHDFLTMGQVVVISNPNGQQGEFHRIWRDDTRFHKYRYCWLASPSNTIEEYLEAKKNTLTHTFDSVYAATFSSASGGYILRSEYDDAEKLEYSEGIPDGVVLHLGLDKTGEDTISKQTDDSILVGVYELPKNKPEDKPIYREAYLRTWKGNSYIYDKEDKTKGNEIYEEIARLSKAYSISGLSYDKPGVSDAVKRDLINLYILPEYMINSLTYSVQNKTEVYNNMKFLFEQRRLQLLRDSVQKGQFMNLHFERLSSGNMKVHHKREGVHDDYPDAVANALFQAVKNISRASVVIIPKKSVFGERKIKKEGMRKNILCKECDRFAPSSVPISGLCDDCNYDLDIE